MNKWIIRDAMVPTPARDLHLEALASTILAGILANPTTTGSTGDIMKGAPEVAVRFAKRIIEETRK